MPHPRYKQIIETLVNWGKKQDDISAALILGSQARQTLEADEWSDLDVVLFITSPETYLAQKDWLDHFGKVVLSFSEATAIGGQKELRVLYDTNLDVDFALFPSSILKTLLEQGMSPEIEGVFARGSQILFDKTETLSQLVVQSSSLIKENLPPNQDRFNELVNDYLYHVLWSAKKIRRGELWTAVTCLNCYMNKPLLELIEWHSQFIRDILDTWHKGRFIEHWADKRILVGLEANFANYHEEAIWQALMDATKLFGWIALELAEHLKLEFPKEAYEYIKVVLKTLYDEKPQAL